MCHVRTCSTLIKAEGQIRILQSHFHIINSHSSSRIEKQEVCVDLFLDLMHLVLPNPLQNVFVPATIRSMKSSLKKGLIPSLRDLLVLPLRIKSSYSTYCSLSKKEKSKHCTFLPHPNCLFRHFTQ